MMIYLRCPNHAQTFSPLHLSIFSVAMLHLDIQDMQSPHIRHRPVHEHESIMRSNILPNSQGDSPPWRQVDRLFQAKSKKLSCLHYSIVSQTEQKHRWGVGEVCVTFMISSVEIWTGPNYLFLSDLSTPESRYSSSMRSFDVTSQSSKCTTWQLNNFRTRRFWHII